MHGEMRQERGKGVTVRRGRGGEGREGGGVGVGGLKKIQPIIDKLYTQIGNANRLHNIIEPFAALFWALGIVLAHILQ